jgi:glutathione-regulated potassium-efflux system ancillary protein KefC
MLLTPLLLVAADRWLTPLLARRRTAQARGETDLAEPQDAPIIIAGCGRYGQIVSRLLFANGLSATVLDHDAEAIEGLRQLGWKVYYGDAARLDLLRVAGAERARVFVLAIDDIEQSAACAQLVREHFPHLTIVARARNAGHYARLRQLGIEQVERETLDSALMSGRSVLEAMGWERHAARNQALRFRRHSVELLEEMVPHIADEQRLIAIAKQGRQQLEQTWAREREQSLARTQRAGWHAAGADPGADADADHGGASDRSPGQATR